MDRGAMPHAVWMEALFLKRWTNTGSVLEMFSQQVSNAEAGNGVAGMVCKDGHRPPSINPSLLQKLTQKMSRFRPDRTDPLLAAFSKDANTEGLRKLQIVGFEVNQFLYTGTRVEHEAQKRVISPAISSGPIHRIQDCLNFLKFKVINYSRGSSLEWDAQDPLTLIQHLRVYSCNIAEEAVYGSKAAVSGPRLVVPVFFKMIKEGGDLIHSHIFDF
jgi:hypothetical protein